MFLQASVILLTGGRGVPPTPQSRPPTPPEQTPPPPEQTPPSQSRPPGADPLWSRHPRSRPPCPPGADTHPLSRHPPSRHPSPAWRACCEIRSTRGRYCILLECNLVVLCLHNRVTKGGKGSLGDLMRYLPNDVFFCFHVARNLVKYQRNVIWIYSNFSALFMLNIWKGQKIQFV